MPSFAMFRMFRAYAAALIMGLLAATAAPAQQVEPNGALTPGWDVFVEPIDAASQVVWRLNRATRTLRVRIDLVGATPNKLYQFGVHQLVRRCESLGATFGQFAYTGCGPMTREGTTANGSGVDFGVVVTDPTGRGSAEVAVGPLESGVYRLVFHVRNGAGCNLVGGGGGATCAAVFRHPAPFGTTIRVRVP